MKQKDHLIPYIIITFSLSILLSLMIGLTGGHESKIIWTQYATMAIPALAVLIMNNAFQAPIEELNWNRFPARWLPLALFLMPVIIHMVALPMLAYLNNGVLPWQSWLLASDNGEYRSPASLGWSTLTSGGLILKIIINAIVGVMIVSLLAFLEEIGWRAWMLPRLIKRFDLRKGVLTGAVIWALWHVPFMLSGILYVKGIPANLMVLINPFGIFGAGLVISWFWIKTKSIWIVSIAHGALNNWGQYAFKFMQHDAGDGRDQQVWLFAGVNGSLLLLGIILLIGIKENRTLKSEI